MIQLTKDFAMTADNHCFIVGRPRQRVGKALEMLEPSYYTTAAQAVQGTLNRAMRQGVADGSITTLRQFIQEQERLKTELHSMIKPLE